MKAPAGRPGLDVRRGGERAAPRPAAATCPPRRGLRGRGPRAIKGRRAAGRAPPAGGARPAGGAQRLRLLINPGNRALPARHRGPRGRGARGQAWGVAALPGCGFRGTARGTGHGAGDPRAAHFRGSEDPGAGSQGPCAGGSRLSGGRLALYLVPVGNAHLHG